VNRRILVPWQPIFDLLLQILIFFMIASVLFSGARQAGSWGSSLRSMISERTPMVKVPVGIQMQQINSRIIYTLRDTANIAGVSFSNYDDLIRALNEFRDRPTAIAITAARSVHWSEVLRVYDYCRNKLKASPLFLGTEDQLQNR